MERPGNDLPAASLPTTSGACRKPRFSLTWPMKIYAVADLHGREDRLDLVRQKALATKADAIIAAGDIGGLFSQAKTAVRLGAMPVPVLAVRGNSDRSRVEANYWPLQQVRSLHLQKIRLQNHWLTGISGTLLLPFASRLCVAETSFVTRHLSLFQDVSIIVAHPPPRGVRDKVAGRFHAGSAALRRLVLAHQPPVVICGHIHEDAGTAFLGRTLVVNCSMGKTGAGALVSFSPEGTVSAVMLDR